MAPPPTPRPDRGAPPLPQLAAEACPPATPNNPAQRLGRWLRRWGQGPDDWALWHRACDGDAQAAHQLVGRLTPQALGLARQLLRHPTDADDAVQDAFLRLWRSRPSDAHGAQLATYFNTIVIHRCRSLLAKRRELALDPVDLATLHEAHSAAESPPVAHGPAVDAAPLRPERLAAALQALPPRQRLALAMWAHADASAAEIASALDIAPNAAHQLLHRAKQALKAQLHPDGDTA